MTKRFREIEHRIIACLCWHVAAATDDQICDTFIEDGLARENIVRTLQRLARRQFIERTSASLIVLAQQFPLAAWRIGTPIPDFHHLAWQLEKRWRSTSPAPHCVSWATGNAIQLFGGVIHGLRQPFQLQHDLGTAGIYFRMRPRLSRRLRWVSEDCYRRLFQTSPREKIADAVLLNTADQIRTAIEFGGHYDVQRLRSFHRYWSRKRISYQIW